MSSIESTNMILKEPTVSSLSGNMYGYESNKTGGAKRKSRRTRMTRRTRKQKRTNKRKTQKKKCWWNMMQ